MSVDREKGSRRLLMLLFKVSPLCCKCICAEIKIDVIRMFRNVQDYVLIKFGTFFFLTTQ